jgi:phosphomannomutase
MLRVSGTEPVVRIYAEATSEKAVQDLVGEGLKLINSVDPTGGVGGGGRSEQE